MPTSLHLSVQALVLRAQLSWAYAKSWNKLPALMAYLEILKAYPFLVCLPGWQLSISSCKATCKIVPIIRASYCSEKEELGKSRGDPKK